MDMEEKIRRITNLELCIPIHDRLRNALKELAEERLSSNRLMAVSGMSAEELTDAFMKGYRLVSPESTHEQNVPKNTREQIPDIRETAEDAAETIQNLAKAGMSQEDIESAECEFCGTPGKTIGIVETYDRIFVGISGEYIQIFDESYPGFVENMPIRFCPMCGRRLSLSEAPFCHCEAKMQKSEDKK